MGQFEIPKEIKSKPKMMGLEMRELVILLLGFLSILTFLKDSVHGIFAIPFIVIASMVLLWSVMPSKNNPTLRNYVSILLFFKRDRGEYHPIPHHEFTNKQIVNKVSAVNEERGIGDVKQAT